MRHDHLDELVRHVDVALLQRIGKDGLACAVGLIGRQGEGGGLDAGVGSGLVQRSPQLGEGGGVLCGHHGKGNRGASGHCNAGSTVAVVEVLVDPVLCQVGDPSLGVDAGHLAEVDGGVCVSGKGDRFAVRAEHLVAVRVDQRKVVVDLEGAGAGEGCLIRGDRVCRGAWFFEGEEAVPLYGEVGDVLGALGGTLGKDVLDHLHLHALADLGIVADVLGKHVGEKGPRLLEADRVDVGYVVADDVHRFAVLQKTAHAGVKCRSNAHFVAS